MKSNWVWIVPGLLVLALSANAQEAGQIVGVVRDGTGGAVAGVAVKATESGTGFVTSVLTGSEGQFVLPSLRPTTYALTAEVTGFRRFSQTGVELQANQSITINISLEVGQVTETINVSGQA